MADLDFIRRGTRISGPRIPSPPFTVTDRLPSSRRDTVRICGHDAAGAHHEFMLTTSDTRAIEIIDPPLAPSAHGIICDMLRDGCLQRGLIIERAEIAGHALSYPCKARIQGDGPIRYRDGSPHSTLKEVTEAALREFERRMGIRVATHDMNPWDFWQYRDLDGTPRYLRIILEAHQEHARGGAY